MSDVDATIRKGYAEGWLVIEIAEKLGLTRNAVIGRAYSMGLSRKLTRERRRRSILRRMAILPYHKAAMDRGPILDAWAAGVSAKTIARETGHTIGVVRNVIFRARLKGDRRAARRYANHQHGATP